MKQENFNNRPLSIPIHPGIYLKKELDKRQLKQKEFAKDIGMATSQLNEIIKGKRGISIEWAIMLEAVFGISKDYWLNLQKEYEFAKISQDEQLMNRTVYLKHWYQIREYTDIDFFKKKKLLSDILEKNVSLMLTFLNVSTSQEIQQEFRKLALKKFKKSSALIENNKYSFTWVKYVEYLAKGEKVSMFDKNSQDQLINQIKSVFLEDKLIKRLKELLNDFGIKLIIEEKEKNSKLPIDGMAFWSEDNPAIGLTVRHKRIDNLAFTVFHELGHIFLHLNKGDSPFIDNIVDSTGNKEEEEEEANLFAENQLIPKKNWIRFKENTQIFDSDSLKDFAAQNNIHPAIPMGRLKFEHSDFYRRRFDINNKYYLEDSL